MKSIKVFCPAKINLSLNVGTKNKDGYHFVDSIMQSIDLGDYLSIRLRNDFQINLDFGFDSPIDRMNNSVMKAIGLIKEKVDFGADITIEKNIPLSGGLGGSSADAAGIIFALDRLLSLTEQEIDIMAIARKVGSDVPFMIGGGCALVSGTGERVRLVKNNLPLNVVIARVKQTKSVCTSGAIYEIFDSLSIDGIISDNNELIRLLTNADIAAFDMFSNALAEAAIRQCPQIRDTLKAFENQSPLATNVSGSGDCAYAAFDNIQGAKNTADILKEKGFEAYFSKAVNHGIKIV